MIKFIIFYCPDITSKLKNKKLSVREVVEWKVSIPSYDLFPTVPLTFDKVFWEAYWPIVNDPVLDIRKVMMKLEKERKENEMKKMSENKRKREREEADRLEAQKKQEELRLRKRKKIVESSTQLPLQSTLVKMKSPEKSKLKPSPSNPPNSSNVGNANAPPVSMITFFVCLHSCP